MTGEARRCEFCGKNEHEVHILIAGPRVFICNECVSLCCQIIFKHYYQETERVKKATAELDALNEGTKNDEAPPPGNQ